MAAIETIYADDVWVWHSFDGLYQDKQDAVGMFAGLKLLDTPKFEIYERITVGNRVIQRHAVVITLAGKNGVDPGAGGGIHDRA